MDPIGIVLAVGALTSVVWAAIRLSGPPKTSAFALEERRVAVARDVEKQFLVVAARLGAEAQGASCAGRLDDVQIDIRAEATVPLQRSVKYRVAAFFDRSLRLHLRVAPWDGRLWRRRKTDEARSVGARFDRRFSVELRDPAASAALLRGEPETRILRASSKGNRVRISDLRVELQKTGLLRSKQLETFIRTAAEIARAIADARDRLSPSTTAATDWEAVARNLAGSWDSTRRSLTFESEHGTFHVAAARTRR